MYILIFFNIFLLYYSSILSANLNPLCHAEPYGDFFIAFVLPALYLTNFETFVTSSAHISTCPLYTTISPAFISALLVIFFQFLGLFANVALVQRPSKYPNSYNTQETYALQSIFAFLVLYILEIAGIPTPAVVGYVYPLFC